MRLKALAELYTMQSFAQLQNLIFFKKLVIRICQNLRKCSEILRNSQFFKPIFCENFEIAGVQKDANLVELEKCIKMLSNAYFVAKFRFDTAENEPAKNLHTFI